MTEITITYSHAFDDFIPEWQRYEVVRQLGRGEHSIVWLAYDPLSERNVAIKQFHLGASVPCQEFAYLADLRHRGIPRGYELFQEQGRWHIVMEPVFGDTLKTLRRVHGGVMPVEDVRDIGVQLAAILDELHSNSILYRDLNPANVVREASGRVRLVDYGSACTDESNECSVSTPYASPEQRIRSACIDEITDIYSLGVVLHELLTGRVESGECVMEDVVAEKIRLACVSMCSYDPERRPECALEVIRQLLRA